VGKLEQFLREPDLIENFKDRGMNCVAAKFTVEILVHFEKSHGDAAPGQEESEHSAGRASANDAT
jgi:hypothetical protein